MKLSDIHTRYIHMLLRLTSLAVVCISALAAEGADWKADTCAMTGPGGQPVNAGTWFQSPFTDPEDPAARPEAGTLANLGDKNPHTYWHSNYHTQADVAGHYIDVGLMYPIENRQIAVQIIRRDGSDYSVPIEFAIYTTHDINLEPISYYGTVELPYTPWYGGERTDNSCLSMEFRINCLSVQKLRLVCTKAIRIRDDGSKVFDDVNHFAVCDIFVYDMGPKKPVIMDMPGCKPIIESVDQLSTPFHKPDSDHDHLEWMIDNVSTTMFESNWSDYRDGRPQYLDVDMLQGYAGHNLLMRWQNRHHEGSYTGYLQKFKIYTSEDKENWTLCDEFNKPFKKDWDQGRIDWVEFVPRNNGRYLRLESTESSSMAHEGHNAFAIAELQFYDMGQGKATHKPAAALIYGIDQFSCNQPHLWEGNLDWLLDKQNWTVFSTWYWADANSAGYKPEQHYLQVDLRCRLHNDDNITLCIQRRPDVILRFQPINLRVCGSENGTDWWHVTDLIMDHSDACRGFYQTSDFFKAEGARYLRFYSNEALQDEGTPHEFNGAFCFSEFRLYKTQDPKIETLFYPSRSTGWDRLTQAQFVNTLGLIHPANHQTTSTADYCDWSMWSEGEWAADKQLLDSLGIQMPVYKFISGVDEGTGVSIEGVRQQAPTVYHELYALPGKSINLVPFSDIQVHSAYHHQMIRWYDWQTNLTSPYLRYCVGDEDHRYEIDGAGSFGGEAFGNLFIDNTIPTFRCPDDGIDHDIYIACDMYQRVDLGNLEANWDSYTNTLYEPAVSFRHIFRIRNGRRPDINESYARKHTRNLTARANADFRIRFDEPTEDGTTSTTRLPQVYRDDAGESKYIPTTRLAVYEADGVTPCPEMQDAFVKCGNYYTWGIDATHPDIEPLAVQYLARAVSCNAANAREGSYVVKLLAGDENRNDIVVGGKNIVLQQFNIDFVNENAASLLSEADLKPLHPEHSADSLRSIHGNPVAFVNFDNYARLVDSRSPNLDSYFAGGIWPEWHEKLLPVGPDGERRFKWPLPWGKSNYGYSYEHCHDYNMYSIATDFRATPYHGGASAYGSYGDRLFIESNGEQKGAFYYVNAAQDPGEMVSIDIDNLCAGSTLYVSGWMNEQSGNSEEGMVNIVVNFKVITPDGETQTVHSYVTGAPPLGQSGFWYHFYYSFVFNYEELGIVPDPRNKYILTLENNALSSGGADYAIDDIQVFVTRPRIYAHQMLPMCSGESEAEMRVEIPFEVLMATMNKVESTDRNNPENIGRFHYAFLKKNVYDAVMANTGDEVAAFDAAVLKYQYDKSKPSKKQRFGTVTFSTCYLDNPDAQDIMDEGWTSTRAGREISQGERWLVFNTSPTDDDMLVGGEYYVTLYTLTDINDDPFESENANLASLFAVSDGCSKVSNFRVHSSGIVKIDGIVMDDRDAITVCVDQRPVVQIDVYGMVGEGKDAHMEILQQNAAFDWYAGPLGSVYDYDGNLVEKGYMDVVHDVKGWKLYEVMQNFRNANRDALTLDDLVYDANFTEEQAEWLRELTQRNDVTGAFPLTINNVSFIFPPIKLAAEADSVNIYVTAIPINRYENTSYKVCTDPSEVRLTVKNHSPNMRHGFPLAVTEGVFTYPEWLEDVPLRIGLKQIRSTWIDMNDDEGRDYENKLIVPLRRIHPVSEGVEEMVLTSDRNVYLADTDDFDKILGDFDNPEVPIEPGLTVIGRIVSMKAKYGEPDNEIRMVFDKNFNFREGHYYRLRFNYRELNGETELNPDGSIQRKYCDGQHILTIKIVPEFQKWVGLQSRNWANDANWSRVSANDLYVDPADVVGKPASEYYPYVTEGRHSCTQSYAPLDFCKVIIGDKAMYNGEEISIHSPFLYDIDASFAKVMHYNGQEYYFYDPDNMNDENSVPVESGVPDPDEIAERGVATPGIQYEMAATTLPSASGLFCRPIYSHTVDQIHFTPGGKIANQQYLNYNRAWVDMEVTPGVWNTLSSPLQETVAGNMYLPSANARQETELFKEMTYDPDVNDRFRPAVYQRAWNKSGSATVHEVHPTQTSTDVAVELAWSHVFNEVAEDYSGGNAFALKVDASGVDTKPEKALFRLPKSDRSYTYYQYEGTAGPDVNNTDIFKDEYNHYRLNDVEGDITVRARTASRHFMVGNPFMAPMDMKRFIEANTMLTPKYWVVDGRGEHAVVWDEFGFAISSDPTAAQGLLGMGYLPPMTSVFVETTMPVDELTVHYSPDMIYQYGMVSAMSTLSRSGSTPALTIEAVRGGNTESTAMVRYSEGSSAGYDSMEDVSLINDNDMHADLARVYTTAGSMAAIINTLPEGTTTGIGVVAPDDAEVDIVIGGADTTCPLYLYDAVTDERTPIGDGMLVTVKGSSAGRYFITADVIEKTDISAITLTQSGSTVRVDAPGDGLLKVYVCDTLGRVVFSDTAYTDSMTFDLDGGIYVVKAEKEDGGSLVRKIVVK